MSRTLLVLLCLVLLVLGLLAMRRGWRNRDQRQAVLAPLPELPAELGEPQLRTSGLYVGTTFAASWQDRVVHEGLGLRALGTATLYPTGLVIDRQGCAPVLLPADALVGARLAPGLAGKVVGAGGLLVITWLLGDAQLDTGFRADDKSVYPTWVRAITARTAHPRTARPSTTHLEAPVEK
jgi:hypothetical protein